MNVTRIIDNLGRIVIPKAYRKEHTICEGDMMMLAPYRGKLFAYKYEGEILTYYGQQLIGVLMQVDSLGRFVICKYMMPLVGMEKHHPVVISTAKANELLVIETVAEELKAV